MSRFVFVNGTTIDFIDDSFHGFGAGRCPAANETDVNRTSIRKEKELEMYPFAVSVMYVPSLQKNIEPLYGKMTKLRVAGVVWYDAAFQS
jgi:hypothetical protein